MVQKQAVIVATTAIKIDPELNLAWMLLMKVLRIHFVSKTTITPYRLKIHRQHWVDSWNASPPLLGSKYDLSSVSLFSLLLVVKKIFSSSIFERWFRHHNNGTNTCFSLINGNCTQKENTATACFNEWSKSSKWVQKISKIRQTRGTSFYQYYVKKYYPFA